MKKLTEEISRKDSELISLKTERESIVFRRDK